MKYSIEKQMLVCGTCGSEMKVSEYDIESVSYEESMEVIDYIQSYASYKDEDGVEHNANVIWGASSKRGAWASR